MSGFMFFIFFVTLIAFIVYWRKKANARKNAGDNYKDDPVYQKISKTKTRNDKRENIIRKYSDAYIKLNETKFKFLNFHYF